MGKKVAVLMGGWSRERLVSLSSGASCAKALRAAGYDVTTIDVTQDVQALTSALTPKPDVVFNALHGLGGEDGTIQSLLEILEIPYTHSSPLASALAMNKQKTKDLLQPAGVPCPRGALLSIEEITTGKIPFKAPYVIKPNTEGSSIGVHIIRAGDNKPILTEKNWIYGSHALVEEYIPGRELSVAVMSEKNCKAKALTVTDIQSQTHFYDYDAKYSEGGSQHILPAILPADVFEAALRFAALAHDTLGCSGISRSDFRFDDTKDGISGLYFLEINTQPGMTPTSLVPEQAAFIGMDFPALTAWLVAQATVHM